MAVLSVGGTDEAAAEEVFGIVATGAGAFVLMPY
jgi:hypothetical protein